MEETDNWCAHGRGFQRRLGSKNALGIGHAKEKSRLQKRFGIMCRYQKNEKLGDTLKMIHIDSEKEITKDQIKFIEDIILNVHDDPLAMGMYYLMNHIPIFLVGKPKLVKLRGDGQIGENVFELWGWYAMVSAAEIQTIYLCLDSIHELIDSRNDEFAQTDLPRDLLLKYVIAGVAIHEFAHALMDHPAYKVPKDPNFRKVREAYDWIEEPMANALMLYMANEYKNDPNFFKVLKLLVELQPGNYKIVLKYDKKYGTNEMVKYWKSWAEKKKSIIKKDFPSPKDSIHKIKEFLEKLNGSSPN